jgi:hypothetical protein
VAFDDLQQVRWQTLVAHADAQLLAAEEVGCGRRSAETRLSVGGLVSAGR